MNIALGRLLAHTVGQAHCELKNVAFEGRLKLSFKDELRVLTASAPRVDSTNCSVNANKAKVQPWCPSAVCVVGAFRESSHCLCNAWSNNSFAFRMRCDVRDPFEPVVEIYLCVGRPLAYGIQRLSGQIVKRPRRAAICFLKPNPDEIGSMQANDCGRLPEATGVAGIDVGDVGGELRNIAWVAGTSVAGIEVGGVGGELSNIAWVAGVQVGGVVGELSNIASWGIVPDCCPMLFSVELLELLDSVLLAIPGTAMCWGRKPAQCLKLRNIEMPSWSNMRILWMTGAMGCGQPRE